MNRHHAPHKLLATLLLVTCVACTTGDRADEAAEATQRVRVPIHLTVGTSAGVDQTTTQGATRALIDGETLPDGSDIFRVVAYAGAIAPTANYSTPYFATTPVNNAAGALSFATTRYYPYDASRKLYFYAWSPTENSFTAGTETTSPIAHYTITGGEDILAAQVTTGHDNTSTTPPNFQLEHKLMGINFQLKNELGGLTSLVVNKIEVIGIKSSANLNIATGDLTFDAEPTTDIAIYDHATGITIPALSPDNIAIGKTLLIEPQTSFKIKITTAAGLNVYDNIVVTLASGLAGDLSLVTITFKPPTTTRSGAPPIETRAETIHKNN